MTEYSIWEILFKPEIQIFKLFLVMKWCEAHNPSLAQQNRL